MLYVLLNLSLTYVTIVVIADSISSVVVARNTLLLSLPKPLSVASLNDSFALIPTAKTSCELELIAVFVLMSVEYPVVSSPSVNTTR